MVLGENINVEEKSPMSGRAIITDGGLGDTGDIVTYYRPVAPMEVVTSSSSTNAVVSYMVTQSVVSVITSHSIIHLLWYKDSLIMSH